MFQANGGVGSDTINFLKIYRYYRHRATNGRKKKMAKAFLFLAVVHKTSIKL